MTAVAALAVEQPTRTGPGAQPKRTAAASVARRGSRSGVEFTTLAGWRFRSTCPDLSPAFFSSSPHHVHIRATVWARKLIKLYLTGRISPRGRFTGSPSPPGTIPAHQTTIPHAVHFAPCLREPSYFALSNPRLSLLWLRLRIHNQQRPECRGRLSAVIQDGLCCLQRRSPILTEAAKNSIARVIEAGQSN